MSIAVDFEKAVEAEAKAFAETVAKFAIATFTDSLSRATREGMDTGYKTIIDPVLSQPQAPYTPEKPKVGRPVTNKGPCKVSNCMRKVIAKGLCSSHYQKARLKAKAKLAKALGNGVAQAITA